MTTLIRIGLCGLWLAVPAVALPQGFVPARTAGVLDVTYTFTSAGKRGPSEDQVLVSKVWNVKRAVTMSVRLSADTPGVRPQLAELSAAEKARESGRQAAVAKVTSDMAPMMASAEAILKKCGEDEACLMAEAMKLGAATDLARVKPSVDAASAMPDAAYQTWRGVVSTATFTIAESMTVKDKDPICVDLAAATCTTVTSAAGTGPLSAPGGGKQASGSDLPIVELNTTTSTLTFALPVPPALASVLVTTKTDRPTGESGTVPTMRGVGPTFPPVTVPCTSGCRSYSGTKTVPMTDELSDEPGTLVVTWTFKAQ